MTKEQWHMVYHLARLATCIHRAANSDEQAEVKAFRQLHRMIQSGFITRKHFGIAGRCLDARRYPHDSLDRFQNGLKQLRHEAIVYGGCK